MAPMRVVVTGGLGALGSEVVTALMTNGHEPVIASRRTGVDLETGAGLEDILVGADAVVHTADTTNPRKFASMTVGATRTVLEALGRKDQPPHLVTISIVGCEQVPYAYYRAKAAADDLVLASGLPATVVRATQFHSLAAWFARLGRIGPVSLTIRGMRVQPVDIRWVGQRLAEIATSAGPGSSTAGPDLTGPDLLTMEEVSRLVAAHEGRRPARRLALPPVGGAMRGFGEGGILPGPAAEIGGERFEEWLARQPQRLRGR